MALEHRVPNAHLTLIGDITVSFALLESVIQNLIGSLINEHQRIGQIITAEVSFKNLLGLTISLYLERHGEDTDYYKLKKLMINASKVEENRNSIAHSVWGSGKNKDYTTRVKTSAKQKTGLKFKSEQLSIDDLSDFVKEIKNLAHEIQNFYIRLVETRKAINNPIQKTW